MTPFEFKKARMGSVMQKIGSSFDAASGLMVLVDVWYVDEETVDRFFDLLGSVIVALDTGRSTTETPSEWMDRLKEWRGAELSVDSTLSLF